jgi:lipopolysaccharide biosynthesis glycosyltransferase
VNNNYYHIAITPDDNYSNHGIVMLHSLKVNNPNNNFFIHILDGGLSFKSKIKLWLFLWRYHFKFKFYKVNFSKIISAPIKFHFSLIVYSRLFLSSILNSQIEKILYLDCDLIILRDTSKLFEIDLTDNYLAAVREVVDEEVYERLEIKNKKYFNAGVLMLNLKHWRIDDLESKLVNFILNQQDKIVYLDQDVLNNCSSEKWLSLPQKYNLTHFFFYPDVYPPSYFGMKQQEYEESVKDPVIIHFTSHQKPWIEGCKHPRKDLYFQYELTFKKILFG